MDQLKSILTLLDKPKSPQIAHERAVQLQHLTGAELHLAAFCWQASMDMDGIYAPDQADQLQQQLLASRNRWQRDYMTQAKHSPDLVTLQSVWSRDIAGWVNEYCSTQPCDLVVKSVQPSRRLLHTPLDWQLLRSCNTPVLLVSERQVRERGGPILATLDFRHEDEQHQQLNRKVLAAAVRFSTLHRVPVQCISVIEISKVLRDMDVLDVNAIKRKVLAKIKPQAQTLLSEFDLDADQVLYPVGKVGQVVQQKSKQMRASMIVVGSCAHRGKQMLGFGNSAERIVANAKCDLLVVHP